MVKFITLSPKTYNTTLDSLLRLEMFNFKEINNRRISVMAGVSGGIIQDWGIHDKDKIFQGDLKVSVTQAAILKNMRNHSTISIWLFSFENSIYEIYLTKVDESDIIKDKVMFTVEFVVNAKVN